VKKTLGPQDPIPAAAGPRASVNLPMDGWWFEFLHGGERTRAPIRPRYFENEDVRSALLELTGGRGPDKCIDAVGMEATHGAGHIHLYDRAKQAVRSETDRPHVLRQAINACRSGGVVSVIGVYGGYVDKFPAGAWMNRSLTLRTGQCHVQRYMRPLLERIERGELNPPRIITHRVPLAEAPRGYDMFKHKNDGCEKVVLTP
jgi:threonine dehydrogenase-like Zn-dependent dehydrogenase